MVREVHIVKHQPTMPTIHRVGIYCRVSTPSEAQLRSLDAQASYLTRYVMQHPGWLLTDIFLDVGSAGRDNTRPAFNRMFDSIKSKTVDIIITKSISRFGRDAETILSVTRMITELGASVFFEEQGINSSDAQSELYISLYGGIAQAERQNISENIRWSYKKRIADGTSLLFDRPCYGYKLGANNTFEIVEEEAGVVRRIFNLYLSGYSILKIKAVLERERIHSPSGKPKWSKGTIERILCNKKYCGFSSAGKGSAAVEIEQHHDALIVSPVMFDMVQNERHSRSNLDIHEDGTVTRKATRYTSSRPSDGKEQENDES